VRVSELVALNYGAIDFSAGSARVLGKGRKERRVPFSFELRKVLFRYERVRQQQCARAELMFPSRHGSSWDQRNSNTGSKYGRFQYTTDGSTWIDGQQITIVAGTVFESQSVNLSSIPAVNNNPNFKFRIVAEFAPSSGNYLQTAGVGAYGPSGTWRFDMMTISGSLTSVPEPAVLLTNGILGFAVASGIVIIRRRKTVA